MRMLREDGSSVENSAPKPVSAYLLSGFGALFLI